MFYKGAIALQKWKILRFFQGTICTIMYIFMYMELPPSRNRWATNLSEMNYLTSMKNKTLTIEIILSYFTFSKLWNKAWKWGDDTSFPQMGEEGCGSRNPTCSLLICLQCFPLLPFFCFFSYSWKAFGAICKRGKKKREIMVF